MDGGKTIATAARMARPPFRLASLRSPFVATAAALALAVGCAPGNPNQIGNAGGSGGGSSSQKGGGDTSSSTGLLASGTGTGSGGAASCGGSTVQAQLAPLTMFIMFDKSGSMGQNGKWMNASAALKAFFQDPGAAGLEVALRFFPDGACDGNACDINACATPQVDAAPLTTASAPTDTQEGLLVQAVGSKTPGGNTPMSAALNGATNWSKTYLASHPDHKVVVVLVTDGEPQGCINDVNQIADIAAQAYAQGVSTFTVGLQGSGTATLNQIAMSGGTQQGFFIGNGNTEADLIAALEAIRGKAIACELAIPPTNPGQTFDPAQVNVDFTATGGTPKTIGHVDTAADCGANGGWYYDDPAAPTKIELCPTTCDGVQGDSMGKLEIVLGCDTIPA
jgi:hypothetical protein